MKKTLAFQTETQLIPTVRNTDEVDVNIEGLSPEEQKRMGQALSRLNMTVTGQIKSIDPNTGVIEFELDEGQQHPEIISIIKTAYELCANIKKKQRNKKGKLIPIPAAKKEKLNQQINDMIKALLEKNKKRDVINHIFDRIAHARNKSQSIKHYLKLFFLVEKSPHHAALIYIQKSSQLKQYADGLRFCKNELNKNHLPEVRAMIQLYVIIFSYLDPLKTEATGNEAEFIIKQMGHLIESSHLDSTFPDFKPTLLEQFTFLIEQNLHVFVEQNQSTYIANITIKTMAELTKMPTINRKLMISNMVTLFRLIDLLKEKEIISSNFINLCIENQHFLSISEWPKLCYTLTILSNANQNIQPFISFMKHKVNIAEQFKNISEQQDVALFLAELAITSEDANHFLDQAFKLNNPPRNLNLFNILLKHKSAVETLIKSKTQRSTPYGHYMWLLNQLQKDHQANETVMHYIKVCKLVLDHLKQNKPLKINAILESLLQYTAISFSVSKSKNILPDLLKIHFNINSENELTWLKQTVEYDENRHIAHFEANCETGELHKLHIQEHSGPHIEGFTANVKNTGSKIPKSRFKKELLNNKKYDLIKRAWRTFSPTEFDLETSNYWVVQFPYPLTNGKDLTLTMQISILDEGDYSIHIHPSHTAKINRTIAE